MLNNFHLAVIVSKYISQPKNLQIKRAPLSKNKQNNMAEEWSEQITKFTETKAEVEYGEEYDINSDKQYFSLQPYNIPAYLQGLNSQNVARKIQVDYNIDKRTIKAFVAFAIDDLGNEILLFQNFTQSQVLSSKKGVKDIISLRQEYDQIDPRHLLIMNNVLTAIYPHDKPNHNKKLVLRNFQHANKILFLEGAYHESSKKDIIKLLNADVISCADKDNIAENCDKSIRRLFIKLKKSKNLEKLSMQKVIEECNNIGLNDVIKNNNIDFPSVSEEKNMIKLLEVLNGNITKSVTNEDRLLLADTKKLASW